MEWERDINSESQQSLVPVQSWNHVETIVNKGNIVIMSAREYDEDSEICKNDIISIGNYLYYSNIL